MGFDYTQFANDLRALDSSDKRAGVLLRWGRDFAMARFHASDDNESSDNN